MDAIILNNKFEKIAIIDYYYEFIWTKSLYGDGEAELKLPASYQNMAILKPGNYISRLDDDMICEIKYTELQDSATDGKVFSVKGADITKTVLNRRIVWGDIMFSGLLQDLVIKLITENFGTRCQFPERRILADDGKDFVVCPVEFKDSKGNKFALQTVAYRSEHESIGDLLSEKLKMFGYGCKLVYDRTSKKLRFNIIKGVYKNSYIVFSNARGNVMNTNFSSEYDRYANTVLVGGEITENEDGVTSTRNYQAVGSGKKGLDRTEVYLDADDMKSIVDWRELLQSYPPVKAVADIKADPNGGYFEPLDLGDGVIFYYYKMKEFKIPLYDMNQYRILVETYKSQGASNYRISQVVTGTSIINLSDETTITKNETTTYFIVKDVPIAVFDRDLSVYQPVKDEKGVYESFECKILAPLYQSMMFTRGYTELSEYSASQSFNGEIDPNATYRYKRDYDLGDFITIKNGFGSEQVTQVINVTETWDNSGYHLDVTVDNKEAKVTEIVGFLCTDRATPVQKDTANVEFCGPEWFIIANKKLPDGTYQECYISI